MRGLDLIISKISPRFSVGQFMIIKRFLGKANDGKAQESEGEKFSDLEGGTQQISWDHDHRTQPMSTPWTASAPAFHFRLLLYPPQSGL